MAKERTRQNREAKKPKQKKPTLAPVGLFEKSLTAPAAPPKKKT